MLYKDIANILNKIESTTKRLEMTELLTNFLKRINHNELRSVVLLLLGRVFPEYSEEVIGIADKLMIKALSKATGNNENNIIDKWKTLGDLGLVAEELMSKRKQLTLSNNELTINKVINNLKLIPSIEGKGSTEKKLSLISELITNASPIEAKFLVRTILGTLRVGIGAGTIRDAIAKAFNCDKNLVEHAYNLSSDFSEVAFIAATKGNKGLKSIKLKIGLPAKSMLYQKEPSIEKAFERVGKPCAVEYKYDGLRLQVHKKDGKVLLFTRRLENVTKMFPEVVKAAKTHLDGDCIVEGEGVGFNPITKEFKAFQEISKRIKRKYDVNKLAKETPVVLFLFDIFELNNESLLNKPFKERSRILRSIIKQEKWVIEPAKQIITDKVSEVEAFYHQALNDNQEGIMMKNLNAPYKPGSRVGYGIKIKPIKETLDLVIVGAEWGQGKRSNWLSSFVLACNSDNGLLTIGKLGTGLSDEQFINITNKLKPLIIKESGKKVSVKPIIIVEVAYEEIQRSPTYSSGFALRFPRLVRFRDDKDEPDDISKVKRIYDNQKKK